MTSAVDTLKRQVEAWRSIGRFPLLDEFVLRNGKPYFAAQYKGARGEAKQCFRNAYNLQLVRPNLLYVEGYGVRSTLGILIHHAWLADPKTQEVIDPTWSHPASCDYFGVPFTHQEVLTEVLRSGMYGLLAPGEMANDKLMFARDPELKTIFEERHPPCPRKPPAKPSARSKPSSEVSAKKTSSPSPRKSTSG